MNLMEENPFSRRLFLQAAAAAFGRPVLGTPSRMDWWIDATGAWYRPYLLWLILIVVTFILQSQKDADEL